MKGLAFAASSNRQSINKQLVTHAAQILKSEFLPTVEIDFIDLNDFDMPIYSIDRENENGIPDEARRFFDKIGAADARFSHSNLALNPLTRPHVHSSSISARLAAYAIRSAS